MKILIINNYFTPMGGAEVVSYGQYKLLKENGHEVLFFSTDKEPFFETENLPTGFFPHVINYNKLSGFKKIIAIPNNYYNIDAEKKLDEFLKQHRPDIIHIHNIKSALTASVLKTCYKNNIPVVQTLHDAGLFCPTSMLRVHNETYCKNELCVSGNYTHCILNKCRGDNYLKSLNAALEATFNKVHKLYNGVLAFTTPSEDLRRLAIKSGISPEKVFAIPNFLDEKYYNISSDYDKGQYFLYVGRISQEKGLDYAIEAFAKLPPEIKLRIVGTGQEKERLEKKVKNLSLKNVEFVGYKAGEDLINEYKNCIATILPCNWFETFGMTIIESFACAKPVIASNLGGIPETVIPDETGFLVESGCIDDIINAVKKLYYEEDYLKKLSLNCKTKSKNYSKEAYYKKIMKLYEKVLLKDK